MNVGDEVPPLVIESVDPEKMKTMAAILHDPNPIHYDVDLVRRLGMGDGPVNQGPINLAWLMEMACRFGGGPESLQRVKVRFLGNVFGGERYEATGKVVRLQDGVAELEVAATANGRPALAGSAWVRVG
jgi:acyl dehydratase